MHNIFRDIEPFRREPPVWQKDRRTDRRTNGQTDRRTDRITQQ